MSKEAVKENIDLNITNKTNLNSISPIMVGIEMKAIVDLIPNPVTPVNGISPNIGANGNWFIGATDTGVLARGPAGLTPTIGLNGNWFIGGVDTGVVGQGTNGTNGTNGLNAANNLQKVITQNYTLSNADNNHTILIDNQIIPVTIFIPNGLLSNFAAGFIQQGIADVSFVKIDSGGINTPGGLKIKGQHFNAYLEQISVTNNYHLIGNLKV